MISMKLHPRCSFNECAAIVHYMKFLHWGNANFWHGSIPYLAAKLEKCPLCIINIPPFPDIYTLLWQVNIRRAQPVGYLLARAKWKYPEMGGYYIVNIGFLPFLNRNTPLTPFSPFIQEATSPLDKLQYKKLITTKINEWMNTIGLSSPNIPSLGFWTQPSFCLVIPSLGDGCQILVRLAAAVTSPLPKRRNQKEWRNY